MPLQINPNFVFVDEPFKPPVQELAMKLMCRKNAVYLRSTTKFHESFSQTLNS